MRYTRHLTSNMPAQKTCQPPQSSRCRKRGLLGDAPSGFIHNPDLHLSASTRGRSCWNNSADDGVRPSKRPLICTPGTAPAASLPTTLPINPTVYSSTSPSPSCSVSSEGSDNCSQPGANTSNVSYTDKATILDFLNTARDTQLAMVCSLLKSNLLQHQCSQTGLIPEVTKTHNGCNFYRTNISNEVSNSQTKNSNDNSLNGVWTTKGETLSQINAATSLNENTDLSMNSKKCSNFINATGAKTIMQANTVQNGKQENNLPSGFHNNNNNRMLDTVNESVNNQSSSPTLSNTNLVQLQTPYFISSQQLNTTSTNTKEPSKPSVNYCSLCDRTFPENQLQHRRSEHHKRRERLTKRGCLLCTTGSFVQYPQYVQHIDSFDHKQKKAQLQLEMANRRLETSTLQSTISNPPDMTSVDTSSSTGAESVASMARDYGYDNSTSSTNTRITAASMKILIEENNNVLHCKKISNEQQKQNANNNLLQEHLYIVPVMGYFCKLCQQFYSSEKSEINSHCQSHQHLQNYQDMLTKTEICYSNNNKNNASSINSNNNQKLSAILSGCV